MSTWHIFRAVASKKAGDIKVIARSENTGEEHILLKSVK